MSSAAHVLDDVLDETPRPGDVELLPGELVEPVESAVAEYATRGRFFYGWLMLPLAMLMMMSTSPGQTFGLAFFNANFRAAFDLTQTRLSATYLVATVLASLALPYIGGLTDRFGLRRSALAGVLAMAGVCVLMSQTQGVLTLFLGFTCIRILGPGTLVLLANNTLARWFDRRLGLASGIMAVAMACAMAFVPAGIVALIDTYGWRGAYLAIAAVLAGGLFPLVALVYRESPRDIGQYPDGERVLLSGKPPSVNLFGMTVAEATQHRAYWILLAATATWALIGTGFVFHLEAIFQSHGLGKSASTRALSYMAMAMATAQIGGGLLADRLPLRWLVVSAVGLISVSCVMLATHHTPILVPSFAVYGLAQGLMTIIAGTAWARYFGRTHLGKIRGMSLTAAIAGSSLGPLLLGVSDDYLGGFTPSLWLFAGLAMTVAIASFWATPPVFEDATAP